MNRMSRPVPRAVLDADHLQHSSFRKRCGRKRVRQCVPVLFVISLIVNMGMWLERFVIIVISLSRDFIPVVVGRCTYPTRWDWATLLGTFGLFFFVVLPLHSVPAHDLDRRSADAGARDERREGACIERAVTEIDATDLPSQHEHDRRASRIFGAR